MNWTDLLKTETDSAYRAAERLLSHVEEDALDWKPSDSNNWMTTGQLLKHITEACGSTCRGFVTGDWGMPDGVEINDMPEDAMLPPAESLPTVASIAAAREALAADKRLAIQMIDQAADRLDDPTPAPWAPEYPLPLGQQLLGMINHLNNHKAQLFYYLKLQGKPVNTMHFYGMA